MRFARKSDSDLVLGGDPRVELLPPEVALREKARGMRLLSIMTLVLVFLIVGGGYGLARYRNATEQGALTAAQAQTAQLSAAARKYSKVTSINVLIGNVNEAKTLAASTEVLWTGVINQVHNTLPAGATIESATMKGRAPWEAALVPAGPLRAPRVATLTIIIASPTILDATAIVRSLVNVTGFADATPDSVTQDTSGYHTTVTLNINEKALSGRFSTVEVSK
jgi:hypothetical protein